MGRSWDVLLDFPVLMNLISFQKADHCRWKGICESENVQFDNASANGCGAIDWMNQMEICKLLIQMFIYFFQRSQQNSE